MKIVVVGPTPPPIDGRAQATKWLIDALERAGHCVNVVNTHAHVVIKALRCLRAAVVLASGARPDLVIVVASGESGLVVEAIPLLATRLRFIPSLLTHHSAHYIHDDSVFLRLALVAGGPRLGHVVLDKTMGAELAARYQIELSRVVTVDNAGLMPLPPTPDAEAARSGVIHVSNLSPAKGLAAVMEVGIRTNTRVQIVGSITPDASSILEDAQRRGAQFDAVGPRYGEAKQRMLLAARCFLFLSSYHHEAQPLVLYEAVGAGCVPIVWRAGWIGEQMERLGLGEYVRPVGDIDGAAQLVANLIAMDDATFALLAIRVRSAFESHHRSTFHQFRSALEWKIPTPRHRSSGTSDEA